MKIITFATLKGGSGKTMNAFNIAGVLAEQHKVLLIDVDPQCNLTSNCGIDTGDVNIKTVKDIFNDMEKQPKPKDIVFKQPIAELANLDIIPSSIMLFDTETRIINVAGRENFFKFYLSDYKKFFEQYDYIIIDTNPSMSIININAFYISDSIVLTSDVSANSIAGAELFCALWNSKRKALRKENNISALVICNIDKRTKLSAELIDYSARADFSKNLVLKTVVPATVKLKNTETEHQTINLLYPKAEITQIYNDIIKELKTREVL